MALLVEVLGSVAATLTTGAFVPQVARTVKTRSAHDFSYIWLCSFWTGIMCWLAYGLLIWSWPIIIANVITQAFVLTILFIKLGFFRRAERKARQVP
ncbi:MAG TPA: SemiSWEET transporter [Alphaproteobacteria bacterium]|nr:SemiSWEET transporter [Alphaproteobacteria bacterium]